MGHRITAAATPASACSQGSRQGRPALKQALELPEIKPHCFFLQQWWDLARDSVKPVWAVTAVLAAVLCRER